MADLFTDLSEETAMPAGGESLRLPLYFPQSFLPERRRLAALLEFAQGQGNGEKVAISAATGIPTGG